MNNRKVLTIFAGFISEEINRATAGGKELWQATTKDELELYRHRFLETLDAEHQAKFSSLLDTYVTVIDENAETRTTNGLSLSGSFDNEMLVNMITKSIIQEFSEEDTKEKLSFVVSVPKKRNKNGGVVSMEYKYDR